MGKFDSRIVAEPGWSAWPAPAKLNLNLYIVGRREDGYHLLQSVFRFLEWGDTVWLRVRDDGCVVRHVGAEGVAEEVDLVVRAARLLQRHHALGSGVDLALDKQISLGGGLGGGSSDAASVLVGLNLLWGCKLDVEALASLALQLGADVPVFVRGHNSVAEGVGERLTSVSLPHRWYVLLDPGISVPTGPLFQAPELTRNAPARKLPGLLSETAMDNVFEPVVRARYPELCAALDWAGKFGRARLSGTGATVFLEMESEATARTMAAPWKARVVRGADHSSLLDVMEQFSLGRSQVG